ncbi:hypothetical protein Q3G72_000827 [Acer saccharum]|nr:hypothetical protein Q3G72_000827 [Acer saccharum]
MASSSTVFDLFAQATPGLEPFLADELHALGFADVAAVPGGAEFRGNAPEVLRANRQLRTAGRVLLRLGVFRTAHLSEIVRGAAKLPWERFVDPALPVRLRCTCRASRVYHSGAAAQRVQQGIEARLKGNLTLAPPRDEDEDASQSAWADAAQQIFIRIERNMCTVSIDTSGVPLHRRGTKPHIAKAPLRETLAAAFLDACGWQPSMPLLDPMCGSGTFVLEAASRAAGLAPGRSRTFACQRWAELKRGADTAGPQPLAVARPQLWGYDRDKGAIAAAQSNSQRAGVSGLITFSQQPLGQLVRPQGHDTGLVICNPPYGQRIGDAHALRDLYAALGQIMRTKMAGWRLALVTSDARLAKATGLKLDVLTPAVPHGGLKIRLYATAAAAQTPNV